MRGMRKNRRSEYKNWVKWGFVPKLGVTLLAALIILSLASCKNAADGGGGSSGNGGGAPSVERDADGKGGSLPLVVYTFKNDDGNDLGTALLRGEQSFGEIKSKVADVSVVESVPGFRGWVVDGDTTLIKDEDKYSSETTFVATYSASASSVIYTFKNSDGATLGTTILRGEQSFGEIKSKVADVSVVESVTGFLGWVVDGDTTLIKDENKYSSETTFVATYDAAAKLNTYNFYDGSTLLTPNGIRVRGETTLAEVLALAGNDINIGVTNFIGWKSADGKIIPTGQKLNESTNFYASYDLRLQSFNVQVDIMDCLWLHIDSNKYTYFDATGVFTIDASDPSAKSSIQKYKNAAEMMYSTKTSDPSYSFYYNEKIKYEKSLNGEGLCWLGQDAAGFSTFEVWTTDWQVLYLSLSGKELLDANDKVVYKRID